jgi:hypothetical protein
VAEKEIMPLPQDLLEQARFLSRREARRPRQASLRRAVSTAYYATFHLLSKAAADQASPADPAGLAGVIQRAIEHGTMKNAAKAFESGNLPHQVQVLLAGPVPAPIKSVARNFVRLQEERHKADYDLTDKFDRTRVQGLVKAAEQLFMDWNAVRNTPEARVFLASLLFGKVWSR